MTNYPVIYNQPLHKDPAIKQPGFNGKSPSGFFEVTCVVAVFPVFWAGFGGFDGW